MSQVLSIRLSDRHHKILSDVAEATGTNMSTVVRVVIQSHTQGAMRKLVAREAKVNAGHKLQRRTRIRVLMREVERAGLLDLEPTAAARAIEAAAKSLSEVAP